MAKRISFVLAGVLAVYLVFAGMRGLDLLHTSNTAVKLLGICVIVLPLLGALLVIREVRFGYAISNLGRQIDPELLPTTDIKPRSQEAQDYLDAVIARTQADGVNWRYWYCVGIGYDLNSQRRLARECMQHALSLADLDKLKR